MEPIKVGDRIGIILRLDAINNICYFLGYGIYTGKFVPPSDVKNKIGKKLHKQNIESDRFLCDDGNYYWMYESWCMSEERFNKVFIEDEYKENWQVKNVNIKGKRRKV